jgi:2-polyprenyl-3-methyl-5-hydroxy-6-metoxy-1,4-benzoquinol methylase
VPGTIPLDREKSTGYYALPRTDMFAELPRPLGRVLDVGCGEGASAPFLREAGASFLSGIEILPEPAERARAVLDEVCAGDALACAARVSGPFDTVLCYDVLEHIFDPLPVLEALRELASPGGRLHVSVPNASHISLLYDLIVRGTFGYASFGHRDVTHVRWFTRRDIVALVGESGWVVTRVTPATLHWRSRLLARMTRGWSTEFFAGQWHVLAERR